MVTQPAMVEATFQKASAASLADCRRFCMLLATGLTLCSTGLVAQETVKYSIVGSDRQIEARLMRAAVAQPDGKSPAVVLVHSASGFSARLTDHYAKALTRAGFVTLEPELFFTPRGDARPVDYLPHAFGALAYLATRPDVDPARIAISGYSLGGMISLQSALVAVAKSHGKAELRFAAHAAFYPLCWLFADMVAGKRRLAIPTEAFQEWSQVPIRIYAGGLDDYDDRDPEMCQKFVSVLPVSQQSVFSVQVYENATHEWETATRASRFTELACKGRGCTNNNIPNPDVTQKSVADLLGYLSKALGVPR